jgi:hypothetical protein
MWQHCWLLLIIKQTHTPFFFEEHNGKYPCGKIHATWFLFLGFLQAKGVCAGTL